MGVYKAADCAMQKFKILASIDYNYIFFQLECIATPIPWNGIEINYIHCHSKMCDHLG